MPQAERTHIEPLDCIVVDGGPDPKIAVIICHGYGASYDDLAPLAGEWISMLGDAAGAFRFVFPDAPHSLADLGMPGGRAWWPINMTGLAAAVQAKRFDELHDQTPPGIDDARTALCQVIANVKSSMDGDNTPIVMGGFSQGAMLTMDAAVRGDVLPPAAMFLFSGTLVCQPQWKAGLPRLKHCQVFQSHGQIDPILPFTSAESLRDLITDADVPIKFHPFMGPHTIDGDSVAITATMLGDLAADQ
ncbi:Phospholipase/Carboxylesterase [Rubripirellula lacrimiformis]|uniref:Phospholipase/Carboxylesterase n=1 Tax=Rubripirellula lacrimiformis TaxID=1930273 RepID=A0A517NL33_9BACT|nr:lysophospholipase [Rubripirellula lacrimiformis]QDT07840.1 Phospholipase/Carboxylesterase [Rubripirellula lacrimiformis]